MKVDEIVLRAYVDGELDPQRREQVEAVLEHSPELQGMANAMRASCLPFRAAFDSQVLAPAPQRLVDQVATWSALAASGSPAGSPLFGAAPKRRQALAWGMGLAASFTAGWLLPWRPFDTNSSAPNPAPWVTAIVGYHAMYVRATVDAQGDRPERLRQLVGDFAPALQPRLAVLDLSSAGLHFRRVQRLGFEGAPLLQMVYLPAQGLPAALCVLPVSSDDAAVSNGRDKGLGVAAWVDRGLAYVLVADMADETVGTLARRIVRGEFSYA
jgi:anti-sigma factor RsiW